MNQIETEIIIDAKPEKVWEILVDFESYSKWNPFIKSISGNKKTGEQLKVFIQPPNGKGMTFRPKVLIYESNKEFRWLGKLLIKGLFDGEHYFILNKIEDHRTRFVHGEKFGGILIPFMGSVLKNTKTGFELMNVAIKKQAEMKSGK